jgi:hypothetical protein
MQKGAIFHLLIYIGSDKVVREKIDCRRRRRKVQEREEAARGDFYHWQVTQEKWGERHDTHHRRYSVAYTYTLQASK